MKHTFKILGTLIVLAGILITSCVKDDFDKPDVPNPCDVKSGFTPNVTIEDISNMFANLETVEGSSVHIFPDSNLVLEAQVVSNDEAGNFYKVIYLQDETGALTLNIDGYSLFNDYPQGQTVHLNLSKLTIEFDSWVSIHEIGMGIYKKDGAIKGIGKIPVTDLTRIMKNNSCPKELSPINMDLASNIPSNLGKLVIINDVQFLADDTAKTYADNESEPKANRNLTLKDCDDNTLTLRSNGHASFAGENVPNGKGSITGIYTKYGSTYQLVINDSKDVQFTESRCNQGGGGEVTGDGSFEDPYNVPSVLAGTTGEGVWVQGFLTGIVETTVEPFVAKLEPPFNTHTNVYIAANANETDTTKMLIIQLKGEARNQTNLKDNANLLGKEVKYYGNVSTYFSVTGLKETVGYWLIEENTGIDPEAPINVVVNGTSQVVSSLNETFNGAEANAVWNLNGWLTANIKGERNFISKTFVQNNYVQAAGYGATATDLEMWLVSPGINCDVNKQFSFESKVGYWKHDGLTVYISTDFDGDNANLTTSTWIDITSNFTIPNQPTNGYGESYTPSGNYDLSTYNGQTVYFLFKYTGDKNDNTTTVQIDNVVVSNL